MKKNIKGVESKIDLIDTNIRTKQDEVNKITTSKNTNIGLTQNGKEKDNENENLNKKLWKKSIN